MESEEGKGSDFRFSIITKNLNYESKPIENVSKLKGKKVLIYEDLPTNRTILKQYCDFAGIESKIESNGVDIVEQFKEFRPDAVLIDYSLGEESGLTLVERLRNAVDTQGIPIILMGSLYSTKKEKQKIQKLFQAQIQKPIKKRQLLVTILNCLFDIKSTKSIVSEAKQTANLKEDYPLKILIAEYNLINQQLAKRLFKNLGYLVDIVSNGIEVLEVVERQKYDIIFMDVQMPEMDGIEASEKIRKEPGMKEIPIIIAMTASAMQGDREKCIEAGMDDYISKPVSIQELTDKIIHWGEKLIHPNPVVS